MWIVFQNKIYDRSFVLRWIRRLWRRRDKSSSILTIVFLIKSSLFILEYFKTKQSNGINIRVTHSWNVQAFKVKSKVKNEAKKQFFENNVCLKMWRGIKKRLDLKKQAWVGFNNETAEWELLILAGPTAADLTVFRKKKFSMVHENNFPLAFMWSPARWPFFWYFEWTFILRCDHIIIL